MPRMPQAFLTGVLIFLSYCCKSQYVFNRVPLFEENAAGFITAMDQDQYGYMWFAGTSLYRYDGYHVKIFKNDPTNSNSLAPARLESILADKDGIIWIGTFGAGLDRFDPATNTFTHFLNSPDNASSLSNNIVTSLLQDRDGTIWIGTHGGLNSLDRATGKFTRYQRVAGNEHSLGNDQVRSLYEDRQGVIWIGCGSPYGNETPPGEGGLNSFNKKTNQFQRYLHDDNDPESLVDNKVRGIYEDTRGNFWAGTFGDGLHLLDRQTGKFKRLSYNKDAPGGLSAPTINNNITGVNCITEDKTGALWFGSFYGGIKRYDPATGKVTHFVANKDDEKSLGENSIWDFSKSKDGILWITTQANVYRVDPEIRQVAHVATGGNVRTFFESPAGTLWIGTDSGLVKRDIKSGASKIFRPDSRVPTSILKGLVMAIYEDKFHNFWVGTNTGANLFDREKNVFKHYTHQEGNDSSVSEGLVTSFAEDHNGRLWIGTENGLDILNRTTGNFRHFKNVPGDTQSLAKNAVYTLLSDRQGQIWAGLWNGGGVAFHDEATGKFKRYLQGSNIYDLTEDKAGIIWAGTEFGLYYYEKSLDHFVLFQDPASQISTSNIVSIVEDDKGNLWLGSLSGIYKINAARNETSIYGKKFGIKTNSTFELSAFRTSTGELYFGNATGYYAIDPKEVSSKSQAPDLLITDFKLGDNSILSEMKPLSDPIEEAEEIVLNHRQNVFSFDFAGIHYRSPEENRHLYMLEGFENSWRKAGSEKTASYFNVPPGDYVFRVKAASSDGVWKERSVRVIIRPPWWQRWWAYLIFSVLIAATVWGIVYLKSRRLILDKKRLEEQVSQRTERIQKQAGELAKQKENLEETLQELKSTQNQLVQHEKMASLGVLTAGIAHEIKNPLNFVNNFAEVSSELLKELEEELDRGDLKEVRDIAADVRENMHKIAHHGQLADAIVSGMQQHARRSNGNKEFTYINQLVEDYLWVCYNRLREKDKGFSVKIDTSFATDIPKIKVIREDIGIVITNIVSNAFYAVAEKQRFSREPYSPRLVVKTVWQETKEQNGCLITIEDNGTGIPSHSINRVFQPFFTTKPTGKGTGLGLSLSYDVIVKGHNGRINVLSEENEFTRVEIFLPKLV